MEREGKKAQKIHGEYKTDGAKSRKTREWKRAKA
jgi:hypothetical protein